MMNRFLGLALAAAVALPSTAFAVDDCTKPSEWKPVKDDTAFKRVKVQISVRNDTDGVVIAQFNWTDTAGNKLQGPTKSMVNGQSVRNEMIIKGVDGTADFQTVLGDYGTARFQMKFKEIKESRFMPLRFPDNVKCDRNFAGKDNIWKINYTVQPPTSKLPPSVQR
ncbi:MAG: hypothetical protein GC201_09735 [Alphaproteobacteria bacterium]|nr:hypothetical protein [Alphaproteobacteria bacterium]